jgi:hypothetical protein
MALLERELARRRGQRKVEAMKRRAGRLRRRVVASAIVGFVLLWTVVFIQMATGNDPALGSGAATRAAAKNRAATDPRRHGPQATTPPPSEEDGEEQSTPIEGLAGSEAGLEAEQAEAERVEAEQIEFEQLEAEARELEELEPVTTGQS